MEAFCTQTVKDLTRCWRLLSVVTFGGRRLNQQEGPAGTGSGTEVKIFEFMDILLRACAADLFHFSRRSVMLVGSSDQVRVVAGDRFVVIQSAAVSRHLDVDQTVKNGPVGAGLR
jgi:hypothetical protein